MTYKTPLHQAVATTCIAAGMVRRSGCWFYPDGVGLVVNLQKSNYGPQYYLNIGLMLSDIPRDAEYPPEGSWHVNTRAGHLAAESGAIDEALDLETTCSNAARIAVVGGFLRDTVRRFEGVSNLRDYLTLLERDPDFAHAGTISAGAVNEAVDQSQ